MVHKTMSLQKQPSPSTCFITAFAMCLGVNVHEIIRAFPDAEQQLWPKDAIMSKRGHHPQELIDFAFENEIAVITIDAQPAFSHYDPVLAKEPKTYLTEEQYVDRFQKYLTGNYGVLAGTMGFNAGHAVAWDGEKVLDPRGEIYTDITIQCMYFFIFKPLLVFRG